MADLKHAAATRISKKVGFFERMIESLTASRMQQAQHEIGLHDYQRMKRVGGGAVDNDKSEREQSKPRHH